MRIRQSLGLIGRARLPWLLVLPFMVAGSLLARRTAAVCAAPIGETPGRESLEPQRALAVGGIPASLLVAVGASLVVLVLAWAVVRLLGHHRRPARCSARLFFALAPLAFVGQELAERVARQEVAAFDTVALRRLLLGLALQLPFSLACYLIARALLRVARRIVRLLSPPAAMFAFLASAPARAAIAARRTCAALALGYGERGPPPLLA